MTTHATPSPAANPAPDEFAPRPGATLGDAPTSPSAVVAAIDLHDPRAADPAVAGSKAAGLARLQASGFEVPAGVVLPVGIARAWPARPADLANPAPATVRQSVATACDTLGGALAVRTSATWEDGATSAHAGATATVLDVSGVEDTLAAVRHCLDESARAQREHGATGEIAVVLQRLVPAEWAGVAFTADPVTGDRDVVRIAATAGLGEALVQGEVVGTDVTVRGATVDGDLAGLPPSLALEVAQIARRVESAFGRPQDIEWAAAGGTVHLVQARPITVLPIQPTLPTGNNWQKDTAHYPEPLTPFGWSLLHACEDQVRIVFDEMGLLVRGLEEAFVGGEIYGRILPAIGSPDDAGAPPPALVLGIAARVVPALRRRTATARRVLADNVQQRWIDDWHGRDRDMMLARSAALAAVDLTSLDDAALVRHLDAVVGTHAGRLHHPLPPDDAAVRAHAPAAPTGRRTNSAGTTPPSPPCWAGTHRRRAAPRTRWQSCGHEFAAPTARSPRWRPSPAARSRPWPPSTPHSPTSWLPGWPSTAGRCSTTTPVSPCWRSGRPWSPDSPWRPRNRSTARGPTRWPDGPGLACPRPAVPSSTSALADARAIYPVRDDNTMVVGDRPMALLRRVMLEAGRRLAAADVLPTSADAAYLFIEELRAALARGDGETAGGSRGTTGSTGAGSAADETTQAGSAAAETTEAGSAAVETTDATVSAATTLGDLVARRRGEEAWARANPGPAYVGDQAPPPDISRLPAALRRVNEPILWGVSHEYPAPVAIPDDADALLAGVAASPGVAEGPVRVIRGHDDMHRLMDGDVLVCQVTSPAWAPVFPLASAVVADGGGVLSHAAIAAREHGLPAVLGTGTGTDTLQDGQRVRVDGTRGLVIAID